MDDSPRHPLVQSRKGRFYSGYAWLVLKNLIGWTLILIAFVAGPIVPGPGGIPLFLIGFTLVSFRGKRKLTARVLRGKRIVFRGRTPRLVILGVSLIAPAVALWLFGTRLAWLTAATTRGPLVFLTAYLLSVGLVGLVTSGALLLINPLLGIMPPIRRRIRPWLRRHHVRLLPTRYRRRLSHEHGTKRMRREGEIIAYLWKRNRPKSETGKPA